MGPAVSIFPLSFKSQKQNSFYYRVSQLPLYILTAINTMWYLCQVPVIWFLCGLCRSYFPGAWVVITKLIVIFALICLTLVSPRQPCAFATGPFYRDDGFHPEDLTFTQWITEPEPEPRTPVSQKHSPGSTIPRSPLIYLKIITEEMLQTPQIESDQCSFWGKWTNPTLIFNCILHLRATTMRKN